MQARKPIAESAMVDKERLADIAQKLADCIL
jgi:hypothetical protein